MNSAVLAKPTDKFRVERSVNIKAPAEVIFGFLEDFRQWVAWSPYETMDGSINRRYSGAASGVGAIYAWEGKGKTGAGQMEITDISAPHRLDLRLDFVKPMKTANTGGFTLVPQADGVKVTWAMESPKPLAVKILDMVFNMDKIVGKDFEAGLAKLKALAEARA